MSGRADGGSGGGGSNWGARMRVLVVKTSSLGDVVHTLPAVTDAAAAIPGIRFDWVVEEAFAEIPAWHPAVERVIPIALRRWRKDWKVAFDSGEIRAFSQDLRQSSYDLIIDAQGLLFKSALVAMLAKGPRAGYDRSSARDPWAAPTYKRRFTISREQHAIARVRQLFAKALDYALSDSDPNYGLATKKKDPAQAGAAPYLVFLHGTTWPSKHWFEYRWSELIKLATQQGFAIHLPWGGDSEKARAERLAATDPSAQILPKMNLLELAQELRGAAGVVGLDSGLSHLAAALDVPGVTLYGPTHTALTGVLGQHHCNLMTDYSCAPCLKKICDHADQAGESAACFNSLPPETVWQALVDQMSGAAA